MHGMEASQAATASNRAATEMMDFCSFPARALGVPSRLRRNEGDSHAGTMPAWPRSLTPEFRAATLKDADFRYP